MPSGGVLSAMLPCVQVRLEVGLGRGPGEPLMASSFQTRACLPAQPTSASSVPAALAWMGETWAAGSSDENAEEGSILG